MDSNSKFADGPVDTLLVCASFFGYAREIRLQLERRGRKVALFEDRPATDSLTKATIRLAPSLLRAKADAYFARIVEKLRDQPIRDILVIKGEALSPTAIRHLRAAFPGAHSTLYFWDSYRNMPADSREKVGLFDRVLTFDPRDSAADSRLTYRPLFYLDEYTKLESVAQDIDVLFFGTMHGDRYSVIKRLEQVLPAGTQFTQILYFQARWLYTARKVFDPAFWLADRRKFIFKPLDKAGILALIARSRIVVDVERPIQTGFTMRSVEMLGAGKKLVTTNPEIANADFYNPDNIAIVDRRAPKVSNEFLRLPYAPPPPEVVRRYGLEHWLEDVLPSSRDR